MINENIPFEKVFVIGENGEKIGVLKTNEAIEKAKEKKLDLVLISVEPKPIVRMLDYGKFKYERKKKEKAAKEKQTFVQNRQIRLTAMIGDNDLAVKAKKAREFLLDGDRIKVSLKFRGRELTRKELGEIKLKQFYDLVADIADITKEASLVNERFLDLYLQPNKTKIAKYKKENNIVDKSTAKKDVKVNQDDDSN
ncbi:Translation initiation factor 3 [Mycoplasmopsis meleagridis]|uniref:Translation initiation factor IF-3 n=1 Tax=Mycoplasmopsis meleagridis ATCC 25294 TaxID=1264554 RepID=A0A0F5H217_9BACT|nr:translation initiation factor IF-3 [Mycoplasmopsis meleagridis]KKB26887.1 Translation initiation factor 3 [Mycoplasmopsis meleagridis ATCC 25294]KUH47336.1 translation initiation factor IF-3 [Mycoplasmopsis meleagridis]OAD18283.1 Translation initiation factor 3 [Mycoplasmopsis meleagridis]VEU77543.1 translation initiation factor IF-3 [Mycoplasmopsis meleagridis]